MKVIKKIFHFLEDVIEDYIPEILFLIFFVLFVLQVILRYVFNTSIKWSEEVCGICYSWVVFLGASYAEREFGNIYFSLVYDELSDKKKRIVDFIHQVVIIAFYIVISSSTIGFFKFFMRKKTVILRIPFSYVYAGFLVFAVISVIRAIYRLILLIKGIPLTGQKGDEGENQ